jgi:hypothetical protein
MFTAVVSDNRCKLIFNIYIFCFQTLINTDYIYFNKLTFNHQIKQKLLTEIHLINHLHLILFFAFFLTYDPS